MLGGGEKPLQNTMQSDHQEFKISKETYKSCGHKLPEVLNPVTNVWKSF